ncbi:hypothetical protein ACFYXH_40480 [Streptomyces sp. NPDC002730]|uniref:hypothetical protein n=1 Tax=Streptomyces sp. NPDC002730 TaxID=3364662 RepID=UPI0036C172EB
MRNLPRTIRVLTTQVNTDTTPAPNGRRVLVVGRFRRPTCDNCDDFKSVKAVIDGELVTIDCTECTAPSPTAGVIDDIESEDEAEGFEAEDALVQGRAA